MGRRMCDRRTQVKIAHWYYELGLTQEQIAKRLHCSRQRINKIVNSLVDEGVVTITINTFGDRLIDLENALERHFKLKQVVLADGMGQGLHTVPALGKRAAEFLDSFIQDNKKIGVSWGFTLGDTIFNMRATNKSGCTVVQLVGGLNIEQRMIRPEELTRMLAAKLQCDYSLLYAPAIIDNQAAREIVTHEESFRRAVDGMGECDIAIVGIGELSDDATIFNQGYISAQRLEKLRAEGYVGDICLNPYKLDGHWEDSRTIIGADIPILRRIPNVVAVAGGKRKAEAILGALNTGCIDVLILDSDAATGLAQLVGVPC